MCILVIRYFMLYLLSGLDIYRYYVSVYDIYVRLHYP